MNGHDEQGVATYGPQTEEERFMAMREEAYELFDREEEQMDALLTLLQNAHKARKQAILAVGLRKRMLGHVDGTKTRSAAYLEAFDNSQRSERERDEAMAALWEACDKVFGDEDLLS